MPRYIDAEKLCELARNHINKSVDCNDIMRFPFADVQEVKHGKWIWRKDDCNERECICSICEGELPHTSTGGTIEYPFIEKEYIEETDYCPLCGARMDGDEK